MKVLLYFENEKRLARSGVGRALLHQEKALTEVGIDYTLDPNSTDYDILHINTYGPSSISAVKKARSMGKPVIYHAHSTEEDFRNSFVGSNQLAPLVKKYLVTLYKSADMILTPTPYSKELLEGYGITVPIRAISNGVDLNRFAENKVKEDKFKKRFNIMPEQKVIICVGLFFERKGITDFVEIAETLPDYRFIWFGDTPLLSIPSNVRNIVKKDHPINVEFPGYFKGDIIEGAFSGADLFFFPSYEETEGIVVLEALASKQNVLVRDIPVYKGWLKDGENCYMASSNEVFRERINQIILQDLPSTKEKAYQTAESRSISEVGKQLKQAYEDVIELHDEKALQNEVKER